MIKQQTVMEFLKNSKEVKVLMHPELSLGELFDIACEIRQFCIEKMQEAHEAQKPKEPVIEEVA